MAEWIKQLIMCQIGQVFPIFFPGRQYSFEVWEQWVSTRLCNHYMILSKLPDIFGHEFPHLQICSTLLTCKVHIKSSFTHFAQQSLVYLFFLSQLCPSSNSLSSENKTVMKNSMSINLTIVYWHFFYCVREHLKKFFFQKFSYDCWMEDKQLTWGEQDCFLLSIF